MTEKRFWCLEEYKGETSPIVDGKFAPTNGWLCNRLNVLYEENEQLKGEVKRLKCINKQLEDRLDRDIALNMDCVEAIEDWENECQGVIEQIKYKLKLEKIGDVE